MTIHQLREKRLRVAQIARQLNISRNTVYKYLNMTFEDALNEFGELKGKKKLDPYRDWIVNWLKEYPSLSGAQIHDWLKEKFKDLNVGESTVRKYVKEMREIYHIEKTDNPREYEAVEELPPGKQMQVDWGQTIQKNKHNRNVKLYFIAFVLSHSRQKYMMWQQHPFTTSDTIRCHEAAFEYYGGIPEEIVYDQDNLIAVNENAGDLILTKDFQNYVSEKKFSVHLCRKADPESKGKVENVVKFIKQNFAKHRVFKTIENWNERAWNWLERTGNYNVHNTTKKRPFEVFALEKKHLRKTSSSLLRYKSHDNQSITRNVNKDNIIRFKSNRYSVPIGTYSTCKQVNIQLSNQKLIITNVENGEIIATHKVCMEKGKLIKNSNHSRDRSKTIDQLKQKVLTLFTHNKSNEFIEEICKKYGRYRRDQLQLLYKTALDYPNLIDDALEKCIQNRLYSGNDFRDVVLYLQQNEQTFIPAITTLDTKIDSPSVLKRDLNEYIARMGVES